MTGILVDTNILVDILTENEQWLGWSAYQVARLADHNKLFINPIIYAEVSIPFDSIEELRLALLDSDFKNLAFNQEVCFLAGKAFRAYRKRGGEKTLPLPDFFIGAQAAVESLQLLTRDTKNYRTYFPTVELIAP